jgi:hypothetical protein
MDLTILDLPDEILELILKNLSLFDIGKNKRVNRTFNRIIKQGQLFEQKIDQMIDKRNFKKDVKISLIYKIIKEQNKLYILINSNEKNYVEIDMIDDFYKIYHLHEQVSILVLSDKLYYLYYGSGCIFGYYSFYFKNDLYRGKLVPKNTKLRKVFFDDYDNLNLIYDSYLISKDFDNVVCESEIIYESSNYLIYKTNDDFDFTLFAKDENYCVLYTDGKEWFVSEKMIELQKNNKKLEEILKKLIENLNNKIYDKNDYLANKIVEILMELRDHQMMK